MGENIVRSFLGLVGVIIFLIIIFPIIILFTWDEDINKDMVDQIKIDNKKNDIVDSLDLSVDIYDTETKNIISMDFEEYIKGVVAGEMPAKFEEEALKAQSVAARTYAISKIIAYNNGYRPEEHPEAPLCNTIHDQVWYSEEKLLELHGKEWVDKLFPKIEQAVDNTKGEIISYDGQIISEPLFHSSSGGMTEASEEVFASAEPYLRPVESPYETASPSVKDNFKISIEDFIKKLNGKYSNINITKENIEKRIELLERTSTGRVDKLKIGTITMTGRELRELFGFNSTNFTITINKDKNEVIIETLGNGHGVGMSQWGANGMAEKGSDYKEILKHYYTGVEILPIDNSMLQ
jgi:stage II sporulation protein D